MEDIWMNASRKLEISDDIARTWYEKIRRKMVQGSGRYYHNWDELLLRKKEHLSEISSSSSTIVFAVFFQYFEFDGKRNCVEKNCEAFDEFCSDAGLSDAHDEPQPSTSGTSSRRSPLKRKPGGKKKFEKIKDNKYRQELVQKYSKTRFSEKLNVLGSRSFNQALLKKVIQQIKKRNSQTKNKSRSKSKSPSKFVDTDMDDDHCKKAVTKRTSSENLDDDCICIETKPEIIVVEDETTAPINVVKDLEMRYLKFKQYEPIGRIRMNQSNDRKTSQMLTSTPNPIRLNGRSSSQVLFHEDTSSSFSSLSSNTICCDTDDITIVEDVQCKPNEVIVIDDTIVPGSARVQRRLKRKSKNDDSVIFVSEHFDSSTKQTCTAPAFIPLNTPVDEIKNRVTVTSPSSTRSKRMRNELFTTQDEKQLKKYNENAYNPNKETPTEKSQKRMVIIDGSNVAYQHALNKLFSVKGLKICLDYFAQKGHEVKAVVPQYRLQRQKSSDPNELEALHREGKIVFTPCKNLPGKSSTSYDDRFILQLASELDAAVVSNDNYRDLLNENSAFKKIIENRVIGYTWCNDIFILPKDPYGKWGPTLSSILNRS